MPKNYALYDAMASALGFMPAVEVAPGRFKRFAHPERPSKKSCYVKMFNDEHGAVFGDFATGLKGSWRDKDAARASTPAEREKQRRDRLHSERVRKELEREEWDANRQAYGCLWAEAEPITADTAAAKYLNGRGLFPKAWPQSLRSHTELSTYDKSGERVWLPGMLAAIRNTDGEKVALQRWFLTPEGKKADVEPVRKYTPVFGRLHGSAIWLGGLNNFREAEEIGVAEGVETAMACRMAGGVLTAASTSANMLENFRWFPATKRLFIYADHDKSGVGQAAASGLAKRAIAAGLEVRVLIPPQEGDDWLDVYVREQEAA